MRAGREGTVVFLLVVLSMCLGVVAGHAENATEAESRAEKTALIVTEDYIIGPEDVLEISVWKIRIYHAKYS